MHTCKRNPLQLPEQYDTFSTQLISGKLIDNQNDQFENDQYYFLTAQP